MNKTRYLKLVIVPVLILAALIALQAFKPTAGAKNSNLPDIGIGDLRRYEAQLSITNTGCTGKQPSIYRYGRPASV
jgi:hypothetical protein